MVSAFTRSLESLVAALTDPVRRDRAVVRVLIVYVLVWTFYATIAKAPQDIHLDMADIFEVWQRSLIGFAKHPPLPGIIAHVWFEVFPVADWSYYLLSMTVIGVALWVVWVLCGDYLCGEKRVLALVVFMLIPFFNFHALKYNHNTIQIPLWAVTTLFFLRSYENRRRLDAVLAGVAAAGAMYGKYWSVMLLAGLGVAALLDRRRMQYFRSSAPWITATTALVCIIPLVYFLEASRFAAVDYAREIHGGRSFAKALSASGSYLAAGVGYVAVSLLVAYLAVRPTTAAMRDSIWPTDDRRRLAVSAFWAGILVPVPLAIAAKFELTGLWTMASWSLLPVVLLASPLVTVSRQGTVRAVGFTVIFTIATALASPVVAFITYRAGIIPYMLHSSLLALKIDDLWRQTTSRPLRHFSGSVNYAYVIPFYLQSHPHVLAFIDGKPSQDVDEKIASEGIALVCRLQDIGCVDKIDDLVAQVPGSKRESVYVARVFMGTSSAAGRYVIGAIPPRQ